MSDPLLVTLISLPRLRHRFVPRNKIIINHKRGFNPCSRIFLAVGLVYLLAANRSANA
jgi:hypothetical protein